MKAEKLEEIQRKLDEHQQPAVADYSALIAEVWWLRTALTGKELEVAYWQDRHNQASSALANATDTLKLVNSEIEELKAVHGLPSCYLENRWSNCAVRLRKQQDRARQRSNQKAADNKNAPAPGFAGRLFKGPPKR